MKTPGRVDDDVRVLHLGHANGPRRDYTFRGPCRVDGEDRPPIVALVATSQLRAPARGDSRRRGTAAGWCGPGRRRSLRRTAGQRHDRKFTSGRLPMSVRSPGRCRRRSDVRQATREAGGLEAGHLCRRLGERDRDRRFGRRRDRLEARAGNAASGLEDAAGEGSGRRPACGWARGSWNTSPGGPRSLHLHRRWPRSSAARPRDPAPRTKPQSAARSARSSATSTIMSS